jgi:HD-GYP domain-containing protein (c-di-GMP phosphodiesterase class II)/HAMP domain-containing protein
LETRLLRSKVARRIFMLFVLCSLVPILVLAALGYFHVASELTRQADAHLKRETKSAGVAFIGALQAFDHELQALAERLPGRTPSEIDVVLTTATRRSGPLHGCRWALVRKDGSLFLPAQSRPEPSAPSDSEWQRLANGETLISLSHDDAPQQRLRFSRAVALSGGETVALRIEPKEDVWSLEDFDLGEQRVAVWHAEGGILQAYGESPPSTDVARAIAASPSMGAFAWEAHDVRMRARYWTAFTTPQFGKSFVLVLSEPESAALAPMAWFKRSFLLALGLAFLLVTQVSLSLIRRSLVPIERLKAAARRIAERDYSVRVTPDTKDELGELAASFNDMAGAIARHQEVLETSNRVGMALTGEKSQERLVDLVLEASGTLCRAQGRAILFWSKDGGLRLDAAQFGRDKAWRAIGHAEQRDSLAHGIAVEPRRLLSEEICAPRVEWPEELSSLIGAMDRKFGRRTEWVASLPLRNAQGEALGALLLMNEEGGARAHGFAPAELAGARSLASQAAAAIANHRWVREFRELFDALSELIATAIDEKSPYTGGHCRRVPTLTMMIADAVNSDDGAFAKVRFAEEELYELKIAALLHDCGKVATPVHVVDKATKLETIFDRIQLVEARFEILRRDAVIAALRAAGADRGAADAPVAALAELEADLAFLRKINVGGEFMPPAQQERVRQIAQRLSYATATGEVRPLLSAEEVENLTIARGTLNPKEREIINHHVVSTIRMLETLPYPRALRNVPKIAGAHHERCDGKGYPHGLERDEIALQGRILGLADIFEALTAKDRPYKPGKTLSEAMTILGRMKIEGHIDPDLFTLFVEKEVYLHYGREHLDPEQVDVVDLAKIPGYESRVLAEV